MLVCANCRTENSDGTKFCRECGKPLALAAAPSTPAGAESPPLATSLYHQVRDILTRAGVSPSSLPVTLPPAKDMRESLARLGLSFSRGQIIGLVVSLVSGMVVARILPFVYPVFDPILTLAFGSGPSPSRDGFNTNMMTLITFATSFVLSFLTVTLTKPKKDEASSA